MIFYIIILAINTATSILLLKLIIKLKKDENN